MEGNMASAGSCTMVHAPNFFSERKPSEPSRPAPDSNTPIAAVPRSSATDLNSTSTEGRLKAPALSDMLHMHDRDLVQQLDAYARGDFATTYRVVYDAYQHMFEVAKVLSGAICEMCSPTGTEKPKADE